MIDEGFASRHTTELTGAGGGLVDGIGRCPRDELGVGWIGNGDGQAYLGRDAMKSLRASWGGESR